MNIKNKLIDILVRSYSSKVLLRLCKASHCFKKGQKYNLLLYLYLVSACFSLASKSCQLGKDIFPLFGILICGLSVFLDQVGNSIENIGNILEFFIY